MVVILKKMASVFLAVCMLLSLGVVYAEEGNAYFCGFSGSVPGTEWTLNVGALKDGAYRLPAGASTQDVLKLPKPYPAGEVIVEYDFKSTGTKMTVYLQNPKGGSVCRMQQASTSMLQLQHGKDDKSGNQNTVITDENFLLNNWYHFKHVISYQAEGATSSVYMYKDGALIGSVEDKVYMDPNRYASPTELQALCFNNAGEEGSMFLDNLAVYQNDDASSVKVTLASLDINGGEPVSSNIALPSAGYNGAAVSWQSSNSGVISDDGRVNVPDVQTTVNLTATVQKGTVTETKIIPVTVLPAGENPVAANVYYFDFADDTVPTGFTMKNAAAVSGGRVMLEKAAGASTNPEINLNLNAMAFGTFSGRVITEFDFLSDADKCIAGYIQATPNAGSLLRLEQVSATRIKAVTGGTGAAAVKTEAFKDDFEKNRRYHVKLIADYDTTKCSVYIDGAPLAEDHWFMPDAVSPGYLRMLLMQMNAPSGGMYVDNLVIYHDDADSSVVATQKALALEDADQVSKQVVLPETGYNGTQISWTSTNPDIIGDDGVVKTRPETDTDVTMEATLNKAGRILKKSLTVRVLRALNDAESVAADKALLEIPAEITSDIALPLVGENGSTISWASDNQLYLGMDGKVVRPAATSADKAITLTAYLSKNGAEDSREFSVTVKKADFYRKYSFDDGSSGWSFKNRTEASTISDPIQTVEGNSCVVLENPAGKNDILEASLNTGVITGAVVIDMDFRVAADYANVLYVQNPAGGSAARIELLGGALYAKTASGTSTLAEVLDQSQWHSLRLVLDYTAKQYSVFLDKRLVLANAGFITEAERLENILSQLITYPQEVPAPTEATSLLIDNVALYAMNDELAAQYDIDALALDGDYRAQVPMPLVGTFGSILTWFTSDEAVVDETGKVTQPNYVEGNQRVTLTAVTDKNGFSSQKDFELLIAAKNNYVALAKKSFEQESGSISVTLDLQNHTQEEQQMMLVLAGYNGGEMSGVDCKTVTLSAGQTLADISLSSACAADRVEVYLWSMNQQPVDRMTLSNAE